MARIILLNKPYKVLCQFTDSRGRGTLASYVPVSGVYPSGRLDYDSEGLVVLTDSGELQHRIADPRHKLPKTYWIQVEGTPTESALRRLASGVRLREGLTHSVRVVPIDPPPVWPRDPPIRVRRSIPSSWLSMTLTQGHKGQVRRMTAAVGLPTLRLIRWSVGPWELGDLRPGEWKEVPPGPPLSLDAPRPGGPGDGYQARPRAFKVGARPGSAARNGLEVRNGH